MNYNIYNSIWSPILNYEGVNPPNPNTIPLSKYVNKDGSIIRISSNRNPYAVEHLNNGYGTLDQRLGTSLGTKKN